MAKILITPKTSTEQRRGWDTLINEIIKGNVIPVIGSDIIIDDCNINTLLVESLAESFEVTSSPKTFTELLYDDKFNKEVKDEGDLRYIIDDIFGNPDNEFPPSDTLRELLSIKQFPFVITTSFTPIVENVMKEVWGEKNLRVLVFDNNPATNVGEIEAEIKDETSMRTPTVFYMFGRVGDSPRRYAVSETDMLDFCSSWLHESTRPDTLASILRNKYLLMLGNDYSDWLFRFIWYALRNVKGISGLGTNEKDMLYSYNPAGQDLRKFLEHNRTFFIDNPTEVVKEIKERLSKRVGEIDDPKFNYVEQGNDVFISYSRSDSELAALLYEKLTERGISVWYDRKNIGAAKLFENEIQRGIKTSRYFVPLFTQNIELEKDDSHVYRLEWDTAAKMSLTLGRTFIIPVASRSFDFYKSQVPEALQRHNAIEFDSIADIDQIVDSIIEVINAK